MLEQPSGSQEKMRKRWIEFDCQNGVHHAKESTYTNGKRVRVRHIGRFGKAISEGVYATRRVNEFVKKHNCHYPERFSKDLDECGVGGIAIENWPSGRGTGGLSDSGRASGSTGNADKIG